MSIVIFMIQYCIIGRFHIISECGPADVVLIHDASGSINDPPGGPAFDNWATYVRPFSQKLAESLPVDGDKEVQIGSITFSEVRDIL